jgi:hypothetical protein
MPKTWAIIVRMGWRPIRFSPLQFGSRDELNGLIDK